jgi:hypothetical protein
LLDEADEGSTAARGALVDEARAPTSSWSEESGMADSYSFVGSLGKSRV